MTKTYRNRKQKGCSKKRRNLGTRRKGGSCGTTKKAGRRRKYRQQGGGCNSCLAGGVQLQSGGGNASNGALVGAPWKSEISNWPGVSGNDGQTNFYALNKYPVDLQTQILSGRDQLTYTQAGGKHRRRKNRGGASSASVAAPAFGQDLSNLGRGVTWGLGSAYNTLNGYPTAVNPLPYRDQLMGTTSSAIKDMSYSGSRI
jgi:hypothetical protein